MPRTRSLAWSQLKIGILTVTALILATVIILAVGGQGGFPWDRYELKTSFTNVNGLKSGAVVRVAGVEVGKVTEVTLKGASVEVLMEINKENQQRVTENSRAMLGSLSLLGEPIVDISASSEGRPLKDHDFIQSARASGPIADVTDKATEGLDQATALLKDIRGGKGTVGRLFTDEAVYRDLQSFIASAEVVANSINRGRGTLGKLVNDPAAYRQLNTALANLQETTRRINAGEGSLGRLLKDEALAESLRAIIDATPFATAGRELELSVSIGIALCPPNVTRELKEVLAESDAALYAAKQAGRNKVVCFGMENA